MSRCQLGLGVSLLIALAACGTLSESDRSAEPEAEAPSPAPTTAPDVATTETADDEVGASCRGCVEPPVLPKWAPPATPFDPLSEPLKTLAAGTYITRLLHPTVTFTVPEGWRTAGENAYGLTLSTSFTQTTAETVWKVMDLVNPGEYGVNLEWDDVVEHLGSATRADGTSVLAPVTEGGVIYPAGKVEDLAIGGFPARSITYSMPVDTPGQLPLPHPGFRALDSPVTRLALIDVDGQLPGSRSATALTISRQ